MDYRTATVIVAIDRQSPEIAHSVHVNKAPEDIGAGDQGFMIGYASDECEDLMPLTHSISNKLINRLEECRNKKIVEWLRPDGKVQVTVEYKTTPKGIEPVRVHTVLISAQHNPNVTNETIRADLIKHVI